MANKLTLKQGLKIIHLLARLGVSLGIIFSGSPCQAEELDLEYIRQITEMARSELRSFKTSDFLPMGMGASNEESHVSQQILSHSLQRCLDILMSHNENFTGTARMVQKTLDHTTIASSAQNSMKVKVDAARGLASVNYDGAVEAKLSYEIIGQRTNFEITQRLDNNKRLVFNVTDQDNETRQIIGFQMEW